MEDYRTLVENVSDGVIHLSLDGAVQYVNTVVEANSKLSRDEIIGKHFSEVWPNPPSLPHQEYRTWTEAFQAVIETGKPVVLNNYPIRYRNPHSSEEIAFVLKMVPQVIDGQLRAVTVFVEYFTEQLRLQEQILRSEARYRSLVENANDAIWILNTDGKFVFVNRIFEQITGHSRQSLAGKSFLEAGIIAPEFLDLVRFEFRRRLEGVSEKSYEIEVVDAVGDRVPVEINSQILYVDGRIVGVQGIGRDIRQRKALEKELVATKNHLQSIIDSALDAIIATDQDGKIVSWNKGAEAVFQLKCEEMIGQSIEKVFPQDKYFQYYRARCNLMLGNGVSDLEFTWTRPDGQQIYLNVSISPVKDDKGVVQGASAIARNTTEKKKLEVTLQQLVITDYLTETYNRYYFDQLLEKELMRSRRYGYALSILLIDIDGFKEINDHHGHLVGDQVLKETARILKSSIRNSDTVVRYGGDEFLILLPETDRSKIKYVIRRVDEKLKSWNEAQTFLDKPLQVSIGYATCLNGEDFERSLRMADMVMYQNKNRKR